MLPVDRADVLRAAADLEEARSAIAAIGIVLSAAAYTLSDALRREAKRQRAELAEARKAKRCRPPAPKTRRRGR